VSNAVEGLGDEAGRLDHDGFMQFMGRLLQCGAVTISSSKFKEDKEDDAGNSDDASHSSDWMAAMTVELDEDAVDENTDGAPEAPARAWMTSLAGNEEPDESDTEVTQPVALSTRAAAWMNMMVTSDKAGEIKETYVNKVTATTVWMDAMADSDEEPDEEHNENALLDLCFTAKPQGVIQPMGETAEEFDKDFNRLLDFSFTAKKPAFTPEPMDVAKELVGDEAEEDFDQLIDIDFMANKRAEVHGVVNWMDMMLAPADDECEEETVVIG